MDINSQRLDAVNILAKQYLQELDSAIRVTKTLSLESAVEGADYVINTILAYPTTKDHDGFTSWEEMTKIGEKYGYYRGIDSQEFNMVSTYTYGLCSYYDLRAALSIAKTMEKLSSKGIILQTGNPVFEITQLLHRESSVQTIGFCHGYGGVQEVFRTLGLQTESVDWQVAGANHGIWLNRFRYHGENAYPILDQWISEKLSTWKSFRSLSDLSALNQKNCGSPQFSPCKLPKEPSLS